MKTVKDVLTSVVGKLQDTFPEVPIESEDIDQNINNPCFHVRIGGTRDGSPDLLHDYGTVTVYYFPTDRHDCEIELLNVQQYINTALFPVLSLDEDFAIPINELEFDTTDNVLVATFDFEMWQKPEEDADPKMEHLEIE